MRSDNVVIYKFSMIHGCLDETVFNESEHAIRV